ncbi:hybrid sensor histidine kinase/response regulator [Herpetosiphon llansteffanensis]|uniref:hybrid sensor histidine kinase/response regulator n=1 Tax=Herpetosiphon llansteffanensis TaxID=2094568 RepID=UPI000D7BF8D4|nr:response regulator [Herpetosiphon llansteffanensis]
MGGFDLSAFFGQFREETEENVRALTTGLLALESNPGDREAIDTIFRAAHTIKGSARMLGQIDMGRLAHSMESLLSALRSGMLAMNASINDVLLASADVLLALNANVNEPPPTDPNVDILVEQLNALAAGESLPSAPPAKKPAPIVEPVAEPAPEPEPVVLEQPKPEPAPVAAPPAPKKAKPASEVVKPINTTRSTVRVPIARLDRLLNTAGELVVTRQLHLEHVADLEALDKLLTKSERLSQQLSERLTGQRVTFQQRREASELASQLQNLAQATRNQLRLLSERWSSHSAASEALVDELEAEVMATRLQPVAGLFAPIPRAVRELARSLGKEVNLITEGETTEADRKVIELMADPLLHLVRNALDHGIETPDDRIKTNKPAEATLRLQARSLGGTIEIIISDDGRGIDPAVIRSTAIKRGIIDAESAARLRDEEALELIWQPGFSTSAIITDVSGRGVGMDVVRAAVSEVGGRVDVHSVRGQGTTFTLILPITLLTTRVLLFDVAGTTYALPSTACLGGRRVSGSQIQMVEGRPSVRVDERSVSIVALAPLLEQRGPLPQPSDISNLVVLGPANRPLALLVDKLVDEREVVVKSLGALLNEQRLCTGAIALPDGRLVLVLNPLAIAARAREWGKPVALPAPSKRQPAKLLVAEDSFTTRELLRSMLQSAGYIVETAINGQDALDKLNLNSYDLLVSDVEMPLLTGFELTRRVRAHERLRQLPIIIITSLARDSDRREGLLAGAQAYIVKSQFDQSNLLETIHQLLGR